MPSIHIDNFVTVRKYLRLQVIDYQQLFFGLCNTLGD